MNDHWPHKAGLGPNWHAEIHGHDVSEVHRNPSTALPSSPLKSSQGQGDRVKRRRHTMASGAASTSGSIDYQVTYWADAALQATVRATLPHHRIVHRVLRTTYLDSPNYDLHRLGITLRERCRVTSDGTLGSVTTEAKIPTDNGLQRVGGDEARAAVSNMLGADVAALLRPVAVQTKTRELLLAGGWALAPQFVVALDTADVSIAKQNQQRCEMEAQIFTALPWTKRVDARRVTRFDAFCRKIEADFGLRTMAESGYHAIMANAAPNAPGNTSNAISNNVINALSEVPA